jgi:hypothetical protein
MHLLQTRQHDLHAACVSAALALKDQEQLACREISKHENRSIQKSSADFHAALLRMRRIQMMQPEVAVAESSK